MADALDSKSGARNGMGVRLPPPAPFGRRARSLCLTAGAALFLIVAASCVGCRTRDMRTMIIHVPGMRNDACREIVVSAIMKFQGVDPISVRVDMKRRLVTVTYDSLVLSLKNIEFAVAEAGFQANDVPAKQEAANALPPECRPLPEENPGAAPDKPAGGAS